VWRAARERGELGGWGRCRRGPEPQPRDASARRIAELERESRLLRKRAERAEALVQVQKNFPSCWGSNCHRAARDRDGYDCRGGPGPGGAGHVRGPGSGAGELLSGRRPHARASRRGPCGLMSGSKCWTCCTSPGLWIRRRPRRTPDYWMRGATCVPLCTLSKISMVKVVTRLYTGADE